MTCKKEEEMMYNDTNKIKTTPTAQQPAKFHFSCDNSCTSKFTIQYRYLIATEYKNSTRGNSKFKTWMYSAIHLRASLSLFIDRHYILGAQNRIVIPGSTYLTSRILTALKWHHRCRLRVLLGRRQALRGLTASYRFSCTYFKSK